MFVCFFRSWTNQRLVSAQKQGSCQKTRRFVVIRMYRFVRLKRSSLLRYWSKLLQRRWQMSRLCFDVQTLVIFLFFFFPHKFHISILGLSTVNLCLYSSMEFHEAMLTKWCKIMKTQPFMKLPCLNFVFVACGLWHAAAICATLKPGGTLCLWSGNPSRVLFQTGDAPMPRFLATDGQNW